MRNRLRVDVVSAPAYEVRCQRCDVSFPVGTKVCIHCGGRTAPPGEGGRRGPVAPPAIDWTDELPRDAPFPIEPAPDGRGGEAEGAHDGGSRTSVFDPDRGSVAEPDEEPPTTARSILSSLGGLIWIVLLVAFSIARSCAK